MFWGEAGRRPETSPGDTGGAAATEEPQRGPGPATVGRVRNAPAANQRAARPAQSATCSRVPQKGVGRSSGPMRRRIIEQKCDGQPMGGALSAAALFLNR